MDLDGILALVLFILHWRVVICIAGSATLAFVLVQSVPWITGPQGIGLALLGLAAGAVWEANSSASPRTAQPHAEPPETTAFVAGSAAALAGAVWGALSSSSLHSFFAGLVILALALKAWSSYACTQNSWVTKRRARWCNVLATLTYAIAALAAHNAP